MFIAVSCKSFSLDMSSQIATEVKTFSNQHKLPRLPIPSLEESTRKYLNSLRPLLSSENLAQTERHVKDFIKPGGLGQILQQRLIDVDRISPHNWLNDTW